MANKKKTKDKQKIDINILFLWIFCIIISILFIFSIFKMGYVGKLFNNIFRFIFSNYYYFPIISLFIIFIFNFIKKDNKKNYRLIIAFILFNLVFMILPSLMNNKYNNYEEFNEFIASAMNSLNKTSFDFEGGLIGGFLFISLKLMFDYLGSLIITILLFVVSILLLFSKEKYINLFNKIKEMRNKQVNEIDDVEKNKVVKESRLKKFIDKIIYVDDEEVKKDNEINTNDIFINDNDIENEIHDSPHFITLDDTHEEINNQQDDLFVDDIYQDNNQSKTYKQDLSKVRKKKGTYRYPGIDLLDEISKQNNQKNINEAQDKAHKLIEVLDAFDIKAKIQNIHVGPTVTKYEIDVIDKSVKVDRIQSVSNNIKMSLAVKDIRVEAPIPGRSFVGIEIPNKIATTVKFLELVKHKNFKDGNILNFALGKDLLNQNVYCDLAKMPHMLIAGATGSGKSVCINTIICSFLYRSDPDKVKLILIDPKKVEFTPYHDIPHLLWPVITDTQMACNALMKATVIMQERYDTFSNVGVRNIQSYNDYVSEHNKNKKEEELKEMPYIIIIIDELADLMMMAKKEVQISIQRITQLARACGIHLIVATQRPSVDVITGIIKSNIPSRISFAVTSAIDSRTILDRVGAERLLGYGDMLYMPQGDPAPTRIQGCFISDNEIRKITNFVKAQASPAYDDTYYELLNNNDNYGSDNASHNNENDSLYQEVVDFVTESQKASTSLLQRKFGIGYNRAARLIDTLEANGIVGPSQGSKPRVVYRKKEDN